MLEISQMPLLPGQLQGRNAEKVNPSDLNQIGVNGGAFAIHEGDIIEFFNDDEPLVVKQKINDSANSPVAYYIAVKRNSENSWLGVGILTRRDADGNALGAFQEKMLAKPSFKEIYASLKGRTIKGGPLKPHKFAVFKDGVRTEETRERMIPEIQPSGFSISEL